jgi:hypothetical protein
MPVRLLKCIFNQPNICFKTYGVTPSNETPGINHPQVMHQSVVNFSKTGVPFKHTILIRQLYNDNDQLAFLMGISYYDILDPPLHIPPNFKNYDDLISELDLYPFSIVLTTISSPFLIKFVNKQWETMCGYKSVDVINKTFSVIQGPGPENAKATAHFKNSVTRSLASWRLMLFLTLAMLISPTDSIFAKIKRICKFFIF